MNDKKFWKIIYLYITKYRYSILYYRPEKKDVWLINEDNEIIRFIYSEYFRSTEIDSVISKKAMMKAVASILLRFWVKAVFIAKMFCAPIGMTYAKPSMRPWNKIFINVMSSHS